MLNFISIPNRLGLIRNFNKIILAMENSQENASLALIEELCKRARKDSRFYEILKELSNLSKEKIDKLIINGPPDRRGKDNHLHLISFPKILTLEALKGDEYYSKDCIAVIRNRYGIDLPLLRHFGEQQEHNCYPDKKIHVRVDETFGGGTIMDTFQSLPGNWSQKCLSWNQLIFFLRKYPTWVNQDGITHFLVKKDVNKEIDEERPQDNLREIHLYATMNRKPAYATLSGSGITSQIIYPKIRRIVSPSAIDAYLMEDFRREGPNKD